MPNEPSRRNLESTDDELNWFVNAMEVLLVVIGRLLYVCVHSLIDLGCRVSLWIYRKVRPGID